MGRKKKHKLEGTVERHLLAKELRWWTPFVMLLLLSALASNITALIYPFLYVEIPFNNSNYSIPHTIQLMWEGGLYAIAILIVAFSLTFPFVKIGMMLCVLWIPTTRPGRHKVLSTLRQLGRWSLLDVFVVLIIMVLSNDQFFIGAVPKIGVTLFLAAIFGSMMVCELLEFLNKGEVKGEQDPLEGRHTPVYWASGWIYWLMIPMLGLAAVSLYEAIHTSYFKITAWFLSKNSYSVYESVHALLKSEYYVFGITMLAVLILIPSLRLLTMIILGFCPMNRTFRRIMWRLSTIFGAWSMLDVFALALLLFLTEGENLVKFEVKSGLYAIIVSVVIYYITVMFGSFAMKRVIFARGTEGL
ncbi:MAG: hypothetical protein CMJ29_13330 [Phycisphaerae bacterium]|nr:hypothetical protein [Phycisphaerae bacterium]|tara:strand:+ start:151 stop:1224 length:1074 start_codon:yes stop_codon:yes gene_type:complete